MRNNILKYYWLLIRGNNPIGTFLLLSPCLWLLTLKIYDITDRLHYFIIFILGSFLTRSAGCIINDYFDIEHDKKVARTNQRMLVTGMITRKEALFFAAALFFLASTLLFFLNYKCIYVALVAVIMTFIYPHMKNYSNYPQVFLGITFNLGVLMADVAIESKISLIGLLTYISAIFWTIGYDTLYAYQDIVDDQKNGIKSTAVTFGNAGKWWVGNFYKASFISFLCVFNMKYKFSFISTSFLMFAAFILFYQAAYTNLHNPKNCDKMFKLNVWYGISILTACLTSS